MAFDQSSASTASRRKFHFWRFHVSMRAATNKLFSLHADCCVGMRGKAADPCGFRDSQEWHKITIGFSESVLTGIYRRGPGRTNASEWNCETYPGKPVGRDLEERKQRCSRLGADIFYGPIQRAIYGRAIKTRGGPSNSEHRRRGIISREPLKYFLYYYSPAISSFLNFLIVVTRWWNSIALSAFLH